MVEELVDRLALERGAMAQLVHRGRHPDHLLEQGVQVADEDHEDPPALEKEVQGEARGDDEDEEEASRLEPALQVALLRELPEYILVQGDAIPVDGSCRHCRAFLMKWEMDHGEAESPPCQLRWPTGLTTARCVRPGRRCSGCALNRIESGLGGGGMRKNLFPPIALIGITALTVSCASFRSLQSNEYVQARIQIATEPRSLSDLQFVKGWMSEYGSGYSAQDIGVIVANQIAKQGWHDVWVLVELLSRNAYENEKEDPGLPNTADRILSPTSSNSMAALRIWRISIYAAPNRQDTDFLHLVATGTPSQVMEAIEAGADLNARDKDGATPLMIACMRNQNAEVVSTLLKAGADGKAKDNRGLTAIDYAANNANLQRSDAYQQLQEASQ